MTFQVFNWADYCHHPSIGKHGFDSHLCELSSLTKQLNLLLYSDNSILSCVTCHLIKSMKNSPTFFTVVKILRVHLFNFKSFILDETKITQFSPNATVCQGSRVHFFVQKIKILENTLFEIFIFCPKNSTLISQENCRFFWGEKLVKMLWFWTF